MTRTINLLGLFCLLGCLHLFAPRMEAATTLLSYNSLWRYFEGGYEPSPFWAQRDFDEAEWYFGFGQFGYGDGDESTAVYYGVDDEHKYITTYFRAHVFLDEPSSFSSMTLNLIRDDGAVVYVNGTEVLRDNMPEDVSYFTYALTGLVFPDENSPISVTVNSSLFVEGDNVIAVEIHQFEPASPDLSFDMEIVGETGGGGGNPAVLRGPYLQVGTSTNIIVRWRTGSATDTLVRYGTNAADLNFSVTHNLLVTDHEILLPGLSPDTKYFYNIGTTAGTLAGDASYHFVTAPVPGTPKPVRIWAIGDFGTGYQPQYDVRNAYVNFTSGRRTDVWLMLGDNAYYNGYDSDYQSYCFNIYPAQFRQGVAWPTMGNHETAAAGFSDQLSDNYDYYRIFTLPTMGQAGGIASGTEHYYSFDYANIHFVCLDSQTRSFREANSVMLQWLKADLENNTRDWVIAFYHHPAYSKGSHDSDGDLESIQVRANILPILEAHGVDMVLCGHSHSYERSRLVNGHYGNSFTINASHFINNGDGRTNGNGAYLKPAGGMGANGGTVYVVDGSSGGQGGFGSLNHPAMHYSTLTFGSLVIDVTGQRLDAKFVTDEGNIADTFTILKDAYPGVPRPALRIARTGTNAVISWPTSLPDYQLESKTIVDGPTWTPVGGAPSTNGRRKGVTVPPVGNQKYFHLRSIP
ncbi:MAG TPA: metallophosphoesterase family protein [Verrucomicrobiae bacterium]